MQTSTYTISIDLTCARPGDSLQQLQRADTQLYNAKAQGRKRICLDCRGAKVAG